MPADPAEPLPYATAVEPAAVGFGFVALRLFGLWMATSLIYAASFAITLVSDRLAGSPVFGALNISLLNLFPSVAYGGIGVALAVYALPVARRWFRTPVLAYTPPAGETALAIVTVCVGLYMIATSIADTARVLIDLVTSIRATGRGFSPGFSDADRLASAAKFAIGLALFLRPRWVTAAWRRHSRMP